MNQIINNILQVMCEVARLEKTVPHIILNERLIASQQLTREQVLEIKLIHNTLEQYFDAVRRQDPMKWENDDKKTIISTVEKIEFSLQRVWKFPESKAHHTWWYKVPHCTCPKMDNDDLMGVDQRYYASACPLHSLDVTDNLRGKDFL